MTSPQGRKQSPTKTRPSSSQPTSPDKKKLTKAEIRATNRYEHAGFLTHVPGTGLGGMQSTVPWEVIYKDVIDADPGKTLKDMYRTVQTTGDPRYLPVINDAMIKRVDAYLGIQRPQTFSLGGLK